MKFLRRSRKSQDFIFFQENTEMAIFYHFMLEKLSMSEGDFINTSVETGGMKKELEM